MKTFKWREAQLGLWEGDCFGIQFVVSDDGIFTIHCGAKNNRTIILTNTRSVKEGKEQAEALIRAVASHARATDPVRKKLVEALKEAQILLDRSSGEALGIAMSGKNHPNPSGVLEEMFHRHDDFKLGRAALALCEEEEK